MGNRTQRQRYRRRAARLKATASPNLIESWGWGNLAPTIAADLLLIRQAVNRGWDVPDDRRNAFLDAISYLLANDGTPTRVTIAAGRVLLAMDRQG
jgi:hypothetical protein